MTKEIVLLLGPQVGKLYKTKNPFGVMIDYRTGGKSFHLSHDELFLVTTSELLPHDNKRHYIFSFSMIKEEKVYEDLLAFPVWFVSNFDLIQ